MSAAREGSAEALGAMYRSLHPSLLRYLRAQDRHAEDLASETWIDVATGLGRFTGDETDFRAWVFTIARRRLLDSRRRARRRRTEPVSELTDRPAPDDPAATAVARVVGGQIMELIDSLPKDQADVLLLRVAAGLDVDEVARILRKRPGTVRVLQHRAIKALARAFERPR